MCDCRCIFKVVTSSPFAAEAHIEYFRGIANPIGVKVGSKPGIKALGIDCFTEFRCGTGVQPGWTGWWSILLGSLIINIHWHTLTNSRFTKIGFPAAQVSAMTPPSSFVSLLALMILTNAHHCRLLPTHFKACCVQTANIIEHLKW